MTDTPEDLGEVSETVTTLRERIEDLEGRVDALHTARSYLVDQVETLELENERLRERVEDLENRSALMDATVPEKSRGKLQKINAILDYATTNASGGTAGVALDTGEVAAAGSCSRDTALRLMDEIAANFAWAEAETPGGPRPKQLRLQTRERNLEELRADVRAQYGDAEEAAG